MTPPDNRPRGFPSFAWGVLAYSLLVILWGYFLRISGSGDGCGTDWPLCLGEVVPRQAEVSTLVELTHRISSGVVLVLVLAMVIWALRAYPAGHLVRRAAGASLLLTITESLFGAVLVVFGWVAGDVSTGRILIRPVHVTNTFLLLGALSLTAWWAWRGTATLPNLRGGTFRALLPGVAGFFLLAWTGSWTGLATHAFPVATIRDGVGQYLSPEHLLVQLRILHPLLALGVVYLLVRLGRSFRARFDAPVVRRLAGAVMGLAAIQLVVGPFTVLLLNPVWSGLLHLLLADLLWIGLLFLGAAALEAEERWIGGAAREAVPPAVA